MSQVHTLRPDQDVAPHSVEAEQAVLGAILTNNDLMGRVSDILKPEHFYDPVHEAVYAEAARLIGEQRLASPVTLRPFFLALAGSGDLGGASYLVRLAGAAIQSGIREYAQHIIERAAARALNEAAQKCMTMVSEGQDTQKITEAILGTIQSLPDPSPKNRPRSFAKVVMDAVTAANDVYQGNVTYLPTGLEALDKVIKGLGPGDLMLLGGAPAMGKTATACAIAMNIAKSGKGVAFASMEMEEEQLANRLISSECQIPYAAMRDAASMEPDDFRKWIEAGQRLGELPIRIIPRRFTDMPSIMAQAARKGDDLGPQGLGVLIIDYLQLAKAEGRSRYEQMTEVSIRTKRMAGALGVPVIGLVQLSRDIGERDNKRPMLTDIRESGQFEQDADQVVFCHREEYWLKRMGPKVGKDGQVSDSAQADWEADVKRWERKIELIVAKNRHGPTATAEMGCHMPTNRFWRL